MNPRIRMAHLLRRAGFGPKPGELEQRLNHGYEATVQSLIESGSVAEGLSELDQQIGGILDLSTIDDVRVWWIYRMIHSRRPLVEKMTFFWHGHFATAMSKVGSAYLMYLQNQLFREHGLGRFEPLLQRVSRDPAMLVWLDSAQNKKAHPNENYAREIMELFTVGVGHYGEQDVQEAARAFTGWHLREDGFYLNSDQHDRGDKTVLGKTGNLDGSDVVRLLAEHPQTARHITRKIFSFFVYENPDEQTLEPFVRVWQSTQGNVREVLRAIFLSPVFSSERAYRATIKSPAELVIGTIRSLGGTITPRKVGALMASMGQDLFNPPSVKGWDGGAAWISTSTLFERWSFAASVTTARGPKGTSHVDPEAIFDGIAPTTATQIIDCAVDHLLDGTLADPARQALARYLETPDPEPAKGKGARPYAFDVDRRTVDEKVRGVLHLLLSTPEYQLN